MTLDEAKDALNKFFSDASRSQQETLEGLTELADDIDIMIAAINEDRSMDR